MKRILHSIEKNTEAIRIKSAKRYEEPLSASKVSEKGSSFDSFFDAKLPPINAPNT